MLTSLVVLTACEDERDDPLVLGALVPRTGELAQQGDSIEGAILLATHSVNQAGGVMGRPLGVALGDSKSSTDRGLERFDELLDRGALAIIGPVGEDLAKRTVPLVKAHRIVQITGGVTSPTFTTADDDDFWFRTCPSSRTYGQALAARMVADGIRRAAVLHVSDEYGSGFAAVLATEFANLGGSVVGPGHDGPISFPPAQTSYQDLLRAVLLENPDAFVLIGDDLSGATIINDWTILGGSGTWYFAPSLRSQAFLDRIPSGYLEGMVGVGPDVARDAAFEEAYRDYWHGEDPVADAYFFFDATVLVALAMQAAAAEAGDVPTPQAIRDHMRRIATPGGEVVTWGDLEHALDAAGEGKDIAYFGVSGLVTLDRFGDREDQDAAFWFIHGHEFVGENEGSP